MENMELIQNIIGDSQPALASTLEDWFATCERFKNFVELIRVQLKKKIQKAGKSRENLEAAIFELEIPYLFLIDNRFNIEYEKYKSLPRRTPDFSITFDNSINFNIEVKLIRDAKLGLDFEKWLNDIIKEVEGIPSDVGFALNFVNCPATSEFIERLKLSKDTIIKFVKDTIISDGNKLSPGSIKEYVITGFEEDKLLLVLSMPPHNEEHKTYYACGLNPIFYTKQELKIFGDTICDKLFQMMPDMINILVISTNSSTHEWSNLLEAINSIYTLIDEKNEAFFINKGFQGGISDFIERSKNMSGILFRSIWLDKKHERNRLWLNNQAIHQIPQQIQAYLENMDKII